LAVWAKIIGKFFEAKKQQLQTAILASGFFMWWLWSRCDQSRRRA
jgi:hypothetical protein